MGLKRSPWVFHYTCSTCNGCDIELLVCLSPKYDLERFGFLLRSSPKHADILIVTGAVSERNEPIIRGLYEQLPEPKVVVALGNCAVSANFHPNLKPVDKVLPVHIRVPGCPPRPESIILGLLRAAELLDA